MSRLTPGQSRSMSPIEKDSLADPTATFTSSRFVISARAKADNPPVNGRVERVLLDVAARCPEVLKQACRAPGQWLASCRKEPGAGASYRKLWRRQKDRAGRNPPGSPEAGRVTNCG